MLSIESHLLRSSYCFLVCCCWPKNDSSPWPAKDFATNSLRFFFFVNCSLCPLEFTSSIVWTMFTWSKDLWIVIIIIIPFGAFRCLAGPSWNMLAYISYTKGHISTTMAWVTTDAMRSESRKTNGRKRTFRSTYLSFKYDITSVYISWSIRCVSQYGLDRFSTTQFFFPFYPHFYVARCVLPRAVAT